MYSINFQAALIIFQNKIYLYILLLCAYTHSLFCMVMCETTTEY